MELELVYSGSFRFEKNHQKDASLLENDKNSSHSNRYKKKKKKIEKGELKMKSIRKIWQQKVIATRIEPTTTYFVNEHSTI